MAPRIPARNLLVRCPNWVGDAVMATPALRCLRANYPDAHITLLARPYVRPVFDHGPWADEIVEVRGLFSTALALRRRRYDLAVLLTHSFRSALLVRLSGARRRLGYTRGDQRLLLTDAVLYPHEGLRWALAPKVDLYAGLMRSLGCEGWEDTRPELFYSAAERATLEGLLRYKGVAEGRPLFAIAPGAAFGASKQWSADKFARTADALAEDLDATCLAAASPAEAPLVEAIRRRMRRPLITFGRDEMDLGLLKPLVAASSLMIATDSGPRHYAVAFGVPVVVLMGPTHPRKTDSAYERTAILRHDVPCGPCYRRTCPTDRRCMESIEPEEVEAAARALLERFGPASAWSQRLAERAEAASASVRG